MARFGARHWGGFAVVGSMRLVLAVIVAAISLSTLIGSAADWQLQAELADQWQEYRDHVGE